MNGEPTPKQAVRDRKTGDLLYKGYNGNLVLTDRGVVVQRGAKGLLLQQSLRGEKEIPYDSIVAVQFKKGGMMAGYIQLSLRGGSEAKRGINEALKDENTVSFQFTSNGRFQEAREIINYRVERTKNQEQSGSPRDADPVARLRELAELRDQGVLNEEEFLAAKKRLLGQL